MSDIVEILCVSEVAASTEDAAEYIVPSGKIARLLQFDADAAFSSNSVVRLVWDSGGADELVWSVKGDSRSPDGYEPTFIGDGVKKIAVICENGEAGSLFLSGRAVMAVKDV